MALSADILKAQILQALEKAMKISGPAASSPFNTPPAVAELLANAYHSYAGSASAPPMVSMVSPPALPALIVALAQPNMAGWASGLASYWSSVTWTGPGFIPVNPTVPLALSGIAPEVVSLISSPSKPKTQEEFAGKLATILHTYTTKLTVVTTTLSAPPVVAPASVL